ncbi:TetR/AcrR family transcriptional regulator [Paenibacillus sp. UNC451MF]|uniref:TetR/AcrR family transcriptional regulator n=1 Tax=Paenibacillus sp. UNC451MF TaxID=1449063 RepID=UPI0006898BD7|nr:TetR/AcrR family transcriptional regulator [Paenibacillus sp. UNC451MF]
MDELIRVRILQTAAELFKAKGYRNATLSELASQLGMSKKTLYMYFTGKEQIAEAVMELTLSAIEGKVAAAKQGKGTPLEVFRAVFTSIKREILQLNPLFLEDVQKFAPGLWGRIELFRSRQLSFMEGLLVQAQQEGLIRDLNPKLASVMLMDSIQRYVRPDFAAKHGVAMMDVADTLFTLLFEGIRTNDKE